MFSNNTKKHGELMRNGAWAILVAMIAIAGCATAGQQDANDQKLLKDPAARQQALNKCISIVKWWDPQVKHEVAEFMRISTDKVPPVFCQRMMAGVMSGRITSKDMVALRTGSATNFFKIIKGG
ncbi:hypothetical protein [Mesorhizobium sp. WSM2239]|uniref:Lipoprotein n=2 Tax=unclassified Mesorhizobium TaxID=325217 RepID=A0AAU8DAY3_9HYPH